jgi:hypothetical protein
MPGSQTTPSRRDTGDSACPSVLPSTSKTVSALGTVNHFRGSMAGLCIPLSTLRRRPYGRLRMTRGHCGSLYLQCSGLAPPTPCRSPGAPLILFCRVRDWRGI